MSRFVFVAALLFSTSVFARDIHDVVKQLGGTVRRIAANTEEVEVSFDSNSGRNLNDGGMTIAPHVPKLVKLNLKGTKITSSSLSQIAHLKNLRELHLELTSIDDQGIKHLSNLESLEYLNLYGTKVTDACLEHLTGLKKLQNLYVWQTEVTEEGAARLAKALPGLKVERGVDLSKLPAIPKPKPATPAKWIVAGKDKPPKSTGGPNLQLTFENKSAIRVKLYWVDFNGGLKLYGEIEPNTRRQQNSYANHTWLIADQSDKPLGYFIIQPGQALAVIPK